MRKILQAIDAVNKFTGNIMGYINIFVVIMVCWEIVARYVFNAPTLWATESMVMACGFMTLLAGGYAALHQRHVRIDMVYTHLGPKTQTVCDLITYCFFCLLMYALIWHGSLFAWDGIKVRETAGTPWDPIIYPLKVAVPIGALLIWFQMTAHLIRKTYRTFTGKEL